MKPSEQVAIRAFQSWSEKNVETARAISLNHKRVRPHGGYKAL
jgi:hypothetical protein